MELQDALLVGKRISVVDWTDDRHLILRFDDGSAIKIEGLGYDGLWDDVVWTWQP